MRKRTAGLFVVYLSLLAASHLVWALRSGPPTPDAGERLCLVPEVLDGKRTGERVRLVYRDRGPRDAPTITLLHGSPGRGRHMWSLGRALEDRYRVLVPDLLGFGKSRQPLADYSIEADAVALLALLDELGIERAHLLGWSLGGGVALHAARMAPERIASITLLASIGVQELELFGSYEMNHALHGLQLGIVHLVRNLIPHFGAVDDSVFELAYPRSFYDTDQRPLRGMFEAYGEPMLVIHGAQDFLVPPAAAREHHRIVPQSELVMVEDQSHFLPWKWTAELASTVSDFVQRVESGAAVTRARAEPERVSAAARPFDPADLPPFSGLTLAVVMLLLAAATLVSEDLTCLGAGLLVSQGRIDFLAASLACFVGIFVGDVGLYLVGRLLGRPALRRAPLRWIVSEAGVERARAWFARRGWAAIFLSRFMPGLRLPTYAAAGMVGAPLLAFVGWFLLAGVVWTPALVGFAAWAGGEAQASLELFGDYALAGVVVLILALLAVPRLVLPLFSWRGRRKLWGALVRKRHWEFWPPWLFYAPLVGWVAWLALRHRSLALVTAVNPAIPTGGFVGESKSAIMDALGDDPQLARHLFLSASSSPGERRAAAASFLAESVLELPLVLKPDVGQRGSGVRILRQRDELDSAIDGLEVDSMLQEYVDGPEYGLFYVRVPGEQRGRLFSVTEKRMPQVRGDGRRTLEQLILADPRAVAMSEVYFAANAARLFEVPAPGQTVQLVELGTHCLGAIFLDGGRLVTPALEAAVDGLSRGFEGFWFGRYDVRAPSEAALARGEFRVIELNGLTSEATHIYDRRHSLLQAYRVLMRQWSLAFEIARANRAAGARPASLGRMLREVVAYQRLKRGHA